jgi:hypothetical protein
MTREDIESIVKSYVDTDKLNDAVMTHINEAIDKQIKPTIAGIVAELKEQKLTTAGNFASVRGQHLTLADEVKKLLAIDKTQQRKARFGWQYKNLG